MRKILVASPGTGKTTRLLALVQGLLANGISPRQVCYTTYTKAGADEARDRAVIKFGMLPKDFRYFKTLHALAYGELGGPKLVENTPDFFKDLLKQSGVPCTFYRKTSFDGVDDPGVYLGDKLLQLNNLARNTLQDPRALILRQNLPIDFSTYEAFIKKYNMLKEHHRLKDYTELLELFIKYQDIVLPTQYLFVDEAQDLTPLQWKMVQKIEATSETSTVAGDDKQAIYEWAGADPQHLIDLEGEREILDKSYRLKSNLVSFSQEIAKKIKHKAQYTINSCAEGGRISEIRSLGSLDLGTGTWLFISRLNRDIEIFERHLSLSGFKYLSNTHNYEEVYKAITIWERLRNGATLTGAEVCKFLEYIPSGTFIHYGAKTKLQAADPSVCFTGDQLAADYGLKIGESWYTTFRLGYQDREIIRKALERDGVATSPRIKVSTVHGSKGLEADNVVWVSRLSTQCLKTMESNPDSEHRVAYVAATRAKTNLFILKTDDNDYPTTAIQTRGCYTEPEPARELLSAGT